MPPTANESARRSSPGRPTPIWPPFATPTRCANCPRRSARAGTPCGPKCGHCGDGSERLARIEVSDPEGEEQVVDLLIDLAWVGDRPRDLLADERAVALAEAVRRHPDRPFAYSQRRADLGQ